MERCLDDESMDHGQVRIYAIEQLKSQGSSNVMANETDALRIRKL